MIEHEVKWTAPSQLWFETAISTDETVRRAITRPAILRFASDSFMEDFARMLEADPAQIGSLLAKPETWRGPAAQPAANALLEPAAPKSKFARRLERLRVAADRSRNGLARGSFSNVASLVSPDLPPLKLYQPAHQRHYLIAAHLVCGITGLPDRAIDPGKQERAAFVIRRLLPAGEIDLTQNLSRPDSSWEEYAMVLSVAGNGWQKVARTDSSDAASLAPGEETLPLFNMSFTEDDGRRRKMLAGVIPVGRREAYQTATRRASASDQSTPSNLLDDPRMYLLRAQVTGPWKSLLEQADVIKNTHAGEPDLDPLPDPPDNSVRDKLIKDTREQMQTGSWYTLLDFAEFLRERINNVWRAVTDEPGFALTDTDEINLFNALENTRPNNALINALISGSAIYTSQSVKSSLSEALKAIVDFKDRLEQATVSYDRSKADPDNASQPDPAWPPFLFPLADHILSVPLPPDGAAAASLDAALSKIDQLTELVRLALPDQETAEGPPAPLASRAPFDIRDGWYLIRCVFERPACGPLEPPIVSDPTLPFQMAGFFDPDAPARPVRIGLPIDTSPAGLRKFDKNTAFILSDMLCGQVDRFKAMTLGDLVRSVLPWPLHKDLPVPEKGPCKTSDGSGLELGMMCSLSIPIITICALILLMIIVTLLDFIFRWIPYFILCFPVPGFKSKR